MTNILDNQSPSPPHFISHLVLLFSVYEHGRSPIPRYDGCTDKQMDSILKSLSAMARRMYTAEDTLASIRASENWQSNGPDTKKRRSVGDIPSSLTLISDSTSSSPPHLANYPNGDSHLNNRDVTVLPEQDVEMRSSDDDTSPTRPSSHYRPQHISSTLENLANNIPPSKHATYIHSPPISASSSSHPSYPFCPTCGSSLFASPALLAATAFENGMSAGEELRLLKAQVQDVARVCNAVARGDLSQKITVPVQGVVMVQLKDVINTMVGFPLFVSLFYD